MVLPRALGAIGPEKGHNGPLHTITSERMDSLACRSSFCVLRPMPGDRRVLQLFTVGLIDVVLEDQEDRLLLVA